MEKFEQHCGVAAAILRGNVDTDAIIPSREMKRVSKQGLEEGLFAGWRYTEQGGRDPDPEARVLHDRPRVEVTTTPEGRKVAVHYRCAGTVSRAASEPCCEPGNERLRSRPSGISYFSNLTPGISSISPPASTTASWMPLVL